MAKSLLPFNRFSVTCLTMLMLYLTCRQISGDSTGGIATGYALDDQGVGVRVPVRASILISICRPDRLWRPLNFLSNGYQGLFPRVKVAGA
jgi:hypothetical protein